MLFLFIDQKIVKNPTIKVESNVITEEKIIVKDKKVLLICPTGDKSKKYSAYLNKNGLNVYSLKGGFNGYRLSNKRLEREIRSIDFDLF